MGAEAPRRAWDIPHHTPNDARGQNVRVSLTAPRFQRSPARVSGFRDADTPYARVPTRPLLTSARSSAGERVLPSAHATFAWEKRAFTRAGRRDGEEDAARGARRRASDRDDDVTLNASDSVARRRREETTRAVFRRYANTRDSALAPGRVALALGDLGVFEDDADSCDCEAVGRLVAEHAGASRGSETRAVSFARFATAADVLARRRDATGLGAPGAGAGALVPPELFRNQTLRRVFRSRAGRVAGEDGDEDGTARLSASQFAFWLRDAGFFALGDGFTEAGALVLFARARGRLERPHARTTDDDVKDDETLCLCDVSLRFAPDFVAALALAATARGETVEAVAGALVRSTRPTSRGPFPDERSDSELVSRLSRTRACFAMLDETRAGFVRNDRLASVLAAGDAFSFFGAPRGGDLDAAAAFLHARVHERAPELGFVATRDAREGHVSLRECEAHFLAAARSGFVPAEGAGSPPMPTRLETSRAEKGNRGDAFFFGVEGVDDAMTTFERFCAAGSEAGFAAEPHPRLMDLERFERFAAEARLYDAKLARGAARVAFAAAARGAIRVDVDGFFAAVAAIARHKSMSATDAVECVKRARLSRLATVGVGGNDERFAPRALRSENHGANAEDSSAEETTSRVDVRDGKSVPRRAPPPDPGAIRVADPGRAAAVLDALTRSKPGVPASELACVMADVGALAGVPLVEAGAAIEGARVAPFVTRHECVRLISALADTREARLLDGSFHDETEVPGWIPPALEMYASDARLRRAYAAWTAFGSADPARAARALAEAPAWERSVAEADERRWGSRDAKKKETKKKKENRDPEPRGLGSAPTGARAVCARGHVEGDPREGYVRFRVDPVLSGGADWPDEAQLLGRRVDSGLDRTRRARVPDARRVAFGTAHASRAAAARATARARARGDALGLPSLGTAGAGEGRWEATHGAGSAAPDDASRASAGLDASGVSLPIGMSLASFKTLIVQAGLTGDGATRRDTATKETTRRRRPFTAAAAEAAFATARADSGRRDLSWGAFLDALALVASATGRTVGDVALRVREVARPPASAAGRAPPGPRSAFTKKSLKSAPEPPAARNAFWREADFSDARLFDVDAFARGCDDAHAEIFASRETRAETDDGGSDGDDGDGDGDGDGDFFAPASEEKETRGAPVASPRVSPSAASGTSSPTSVGLSPTWRLDTSKLDLGALGTSLVASLRASEYYQRARG